MSSHYDEICRDHEVRVGGCRCPGPDKTKIPVDCPGDSCPGNAAPPEANPAEAEGDGAREALQKILETETYNEALVIARAALASQAPAQTDERPTVTWPAAEMGE